jgi:hypothetical protein
MKRPNSAFYPAYYEKYIDLVPKTDNILTELHNQMMDTIDLVTSLDDETLMSAYAPGKWSILDILVHLMDVERVLTYRALSIARGDKTPLPGFEEENWAKEARANDRKILNLVKEFSLLRSSTIELFNSFDEKMWLQKGTANGNEFIVSSFPYIICGHEIHHRIIIEERYIGK